MSNLNYSNARPAPSNGLGVAGFIISLIGLLVTGGVLCPIGLLLSLIALMKPPRGFAIAGTIIGLLGTLVPIVLFVIFGAAVFTCFSAASIATTRAQQELNTISAINEAKSHVIFYLNRHDDELPNDGDGTDIINEERDGWGRPMRYKRLTPTTYEIRSAGPDGTFNTPDDRVGEYSSINTTLPAETMPATLPEH